MRTYKEIIKLDGCVAALGCFDGVHIGHRELLTRAKSLALSLSLPLVVLSFDAPPRDAFSDEKTPLICSPAEKHRIFESLGVDVSISLTPTRQFLSASAEEFVNGVLLGTLRAKAVVCGYNYSFGRGREGDAETLRRLCEAHGTAVTVIEEQRIEGTAVSSSAIRRAIAEGDTEAIRAMLGRYYSITSEVVDGQHLARRLGFPTLNMLPDPNITLIRRGVYVTRVTIDGKCYRGITNVGVRPTVDSPLLCAETHIFDLCADLYGHTVTVEFLHFIRPERKFDSVEELAAQVEADMALAKEYK